MPILPSEPDMFPADLWETDQRASGEARWWCLHTKPRQEKAAARELHHQKIPHYLPQVVHECRTPGGRKTRSTLPLFPGYLFLLGEETQRALALRGHRLVGVLEIADQDGIHQDLHQIHTLLGSGLAVVPEPSLPVGSTVRIITGPLKGMVGTIVRRGKRDQFVAIVHFLGRGATVDLEDWQVERLQA